MCGKLWLPTPKKIFDLQFLEKKKNEEVKEVNQGRAGRKGQQKEENIVDKENLLRTEGGWVEGFTIRGQGGPVDL